MNEHIPTCNQTEGTLPECYHLTGDITSFDMYGYKLSDIGEFEIQDLHVLLQEVACISFGKIWGTMCIRLLFLFVKHAISVNYSPC